MEEIKKQLAELTSALINEVTISFKLDSSDKRQLSSMAIYATILENTAACIQLMNKFTFSSIPYLLRGNIEALVDLLNSNRQKDYYKTLHANFLDQKRKYLKNKVEDGNKVTGEKSNEFKKNEKEYNEVCKELKKYRENNYVPVKVKQKFHLCDSIDDFKYFYAALSLQTHNDISVLEKRHITKDENGVAKILIFQERNMLDKHMFLSITIGTLEVATRQVMEIINLKDKKRIEPILGQLNELQNSIKHHI